MCSVTEPINDKPDFVKKAIICDEIDGKLYKICKFRKEIFWNEEFQYVFEPLWETIDRLKQEKGYTAYVPGLDLDLRKESYYRVNIEPQFLVSRLPSSSREDLPELLEELGMTWYDKMEFLIRSKEESCLDNLKLLREEDTVNLD